LELFTRAGEEGSYQAKDRKDRPDKAGRNKAEPDRGPVPTRPPSTKTAPSKTVAGGRARRPSGVRSAAYALALRVASRGLQRGAAEITGRDTFS